ILWIAVLAVAEVLTCPISESLAQDPAVNPPVVPGLSKGTWEVSLATGYTYTYRRTDSHTTKLKGVPAILGVGIVATDPIGDSWYRGQVTLGGEMAFIQYVNPLTTYLASLTPTIKYTFLASERLRPYIDAGAGSSGRIWEIASRRKAHSLISISR
ncbi:MAG: hypothetical protein ACREJU_02515, partial [Nitrospiraceae bacterium]